MAGCKAARAQTSPSSLWTLACKRSAPLLWDDAVPRACSSRALPQSATAPIWALSTSSTGG